MMRVVVFILSIFVFIKTLSYGIYEYKGNNKVSGIIIDIIALTSAILPNLVFYFR